METKEKIFEKALNERCHYEHDKDMAYDVYLAVMDAMEEYANQTHNERIKDEDLEEELAGM